jgi:hypothetical protein
MRRLATLALAAGVMCLFAGLAASAEAKTWNVKITNLTPGPVATSGQPFSAPLWAVHSKRLDVWSVGRQATNGHAIIAEDAANGPLEALLDADPRVRDAATALPAPPATPPIPPGGTREFTVESQGAQRHLSVVWMLVRSNDAFSGLDSYPLDRGRRKGKGKGKGRKSGNNATRTITVNAYDAGTEKNNEDPAYIPGPPFNNFFVRDHDAQLIARHPGLDPNGPLGAFVWTDPVAQIEITRVP